MRYISLLLALLACCVFVATASAAPSSSGITVTCTVGGQTTISGYKGNPVQISAVWEDANGVVLWNGQSANPPANSTTTFTTPTDPVVGNPSQVQVQVSYSSTTYTITAPCS